MNRENSKIGSVELDYTNISDTGLPPYITHTKVLKHLKLLPKLKSVSGVAYSAYWPHCQLLQ